MNLIFCPDCHAQISANAKVCPKCGSPLDESATSAEVQANTALKKIRDVLVAIFVMIAFAMGIAWYLGVFSGAGGVDSLGGYLMALALFGIPAILLSKVIKKNK